MIRADMMTSGAGLPQGGRQVMSPHWGLGQDTLTLPQVGPGGEIGDRVRRPGGGMQVPLPVQDIARETAQWEALQAQRRRRLVVGALLAAGLGFGVVMLMGEYRT